MKLTTQLFQPKPSYLDVLLFTRHLSTLIKAGIPIVDALSTLSDQSKTPVFKRIIESVAASVKNGQPLSQALNKYPTVFDQFYVNLIDVSEASGTLDENMDFIAKQLAKSYSLKKKIQTASLYPILVFMAVIIMGGFIAYFILPQLVDFFSALNVELPLSTKILLFIATAFKEFGLYIGLAVMLTVLVFRFLIASKQVRPTWDALLLKMPVIGPFVRTSQMAQFTRNLGVLIKSGVPIDKSIGITAATLSNMKYRNDLIEIGSKLTKGKGIAESIAGGKFSEFPPLAVKMIAVGEKTGKLDESLLYLGDFYEEEVEVMSRNLTTLLEPSLLLIIGLVVGFVALAIITPIYELSGTIRR